MLSKTETARANKELKSILSQYKNAFRSMSESSRIEYMKTLGAGAIVPESGVIYGEERRDEFRSVAQGLNERAQKIIGDLLQKLRDEESEAPSTEAVNAISILNMRTHISEDEIDNLLNKYGDNIQAYKAISDIARKHEIYNISEHPIYDEIEDMKSLSLGFNNIFSTTTISQGITDARIEFSMMELDNILPTE